MSVCQRCIMPDSYPDVTLDGEGICSLCRIHDAAARLNRPRTSPERRPQRRAWPQRCWSAWRRLPCWCWGSWRGASVAGGSTAVTNTPSLTDPRTGAAQRMRLLFLSNMYPPDDVGGFEQLCQEVTEHLRRRGHSVTVLTSRPGAGKSIRTDPGIRRELHLQADRQRYRPLDFFLKRPFQERSNRRALRRAVEQIRPDVLVVWGMWNLSRNLPYWVEQWLPGGVAHYIASYWPIDTDVHVEYWRHPSRRALSRWLMLPASALALGLLRMQGYPPTSRFEQAMCCSLYVRDTLVEAGALPDTAGVLHVGIDPEFFVPNGLPDMQGEKKSLRLLYVGTLSPHKGVHTAIEALTLLKEDGLIDRVTLTILGAGHPDYEAHLRSIADGFGISERVVFAGWVPREQVPEWLDQADAFLFTSMWPEPMARSVMEAMAKGLLVIGAAVGGQTEMLVSGVNALTFAPGDARALADHIVRAVHDPGLRMRLAREGRQLVLQKFTLERMVLEFETWLNRIVVRDDEPLPENSPATSLGQQQ
jgi:glycogen(starch) synthase